MYGVNMGRGNRFGGGGVLSFGNLFCRIESKNIGTYNLLTFRFIGDK